MTQGELSYKMKYFIIWKKFIKIYLNYTINLQ